MINQEIPMSSTTGPVHPADERILTHLSEHGPEYVPIVATRLGLSLRYAERRTELLVARGLVRPVTAEVVYTITTEGKRRLAEGELGEPIEDKGR